MTVHLCPPPGEGLTPCCGRAPGEIEQITRYRSLVTCGQNDHGVELSKIVPETKVHLEGPGDLETDAWVIRMDTPRFGVVELLGDRYPERALFHVENVVWIDQMCNCESYEGCDGRCCGIGRCSCTNENSESPAQPRGSSCCGRMAALGGWCIPNYKCQIYSSTGRVVGG